MRGGMSWRLCQNESKCQLLSPANELRVENSGKGVSERDPSMAHDGSKQATVLIFNFG